MLTAVTPQVDAMISHVAVIGGGLMGHGIALTFAHAGFSVCVQDPDSATLESLAERIETSMRALGHSDSEIAQAVGNIAKHTALSDALAHAELVIEAAPEKLQLKQALFADIEKHVSNTCLLASNTSVLPITQIMQSLRKPDRALGTHWWNPPHFIPLVEIFYSFGRNYSHAANFYANYGLCVCCSQQRRQAPRACGKRCTRIYR